MLSLLDFLSSYVDGPCEALCFPLLCKLAGIMAQLGSRLIEFHPIKYEYHAV